MNRLEKLKVFLKGYFIGNNMLQSYKALEIAKSKHIGKRKDGQDEVSHQFEIVSYLIQILSNKYPIDEIDTIIAAAFLHDLVEDYPEHYTLEKIKSNFNTEIYSIVKSVTKSENFDSSNETHKKEYFDGIINIPESVIVKGVDRIHNIQTMLYAFSLEKQKAYINEVEQYFFPMLKQARKLYPKYYFIYISISQLLEKQIFFIKEIIKLKSEIKP